MKQQIERKRITIIFVQVILKQFLINKIIHRRKKWNSNNESLDS